MIDVAYKVIDEQLSICSRQAYKPLFSVLMSIYAIILDIANYTKIEWM